MNAERQTGRGGKILIVEDSPSQAEQLRFILEKNGFLTSIAYNGREALELIGREKPALILSDIIMPEMDGYEMCRRIKSDEELRDIPVILLTVLSDTRDILKGLQSGADNFVSKPYDERYLLSRMSFFLTDSGLRSLRETGAGLHLTVGTEHFEINSGRMQILDYLLSSYETAVQKHLDLMRTQDELRELNDQLEEKVMQRTAEIRQLSRLHDMILSSAAEGIFGIDRKGIITFINPSGAAMLGYEISELIGAEAHKTLHYTKPSSASPAEECPTLLTLRDGKSREGDDDACFLRKDGSPVPVFFRSTPIMENMTITGTVVTFTDITERRQAEKEKAMLEERLRQSQKMEAVGQLAGGVAHDFNNMLNAIMGFGSLLKADIGKDTPQAGHIKQILSAAEKASQITRQLLSFSRKEIIDKRPVNINEIILNFQPILSRLLRDDINLRFSLSEKDLPIMTDGSLIDQIILNLCTNARDAMPHGGDITIAAEPFAMDREFVKTHGFGSPGKYAILSVTDTGSGMDKSTMERIFDPFYTTKEVGKGTGLGLSVVYGIVKQHNGEIKVYSEPGKGSTFRIYLPLIAAAEEREKDEESVTITGGTETVLVAEDDPGSRSLEVTVLERYGYRVLAAGDGQEALNIFREGKEKIRLAVLDLIMPRMGGIEAYEEIRKICPDIKAIFLSGYTVDAVLARSAAGETLDFLPKPVSPTTFLLKVREALDR